GPHLAGRRAEQRQQLGRPAADVLVRAVGRVADRLPGGTGLRDGLVGAGLVLGPELQPERLGGAVGPLDQLFLGAACGSTVVTTAPPRRLRLAVPVLHQLRSRCQVYPASHSACRMVAVLTLGSPSGARRSARRRVVSDQAAAPSSARSGFLRNSRRIRPRSVGPY